MGCDIHLFVEKRGDDGKWQSADTWEPDEDTEENGQLRIPYEKRFFSDRNYDLFAILADVRNGRGFGGANTGDGFNPIEDPKGLPDDVTDLVKGESDGWNSDGHSHTWFTVKEIMDYDWTQVSKLRGYVEMKTFFEWSRWSRKNGECPDSYCGGVGGGGVRLLSMAEGDAELAKLTAEINSDRGTAQEKIDDFLFNHRSVYVLSEWEQPYYKTSRHFLSDLLPRLWRLGTPENVRIVLWFDN